MPTLVVELALDPADGAELVLERGALLHQLLGALRIVPEIGIFGELVQFGQARRRRSTSKMPPQQPDRLLDLFDEAFDFRAHGNLICAASCRNANGDAGCSDVRRQQRNPHGSLRSDEPQYSPPVPGRMIARSASGDTVTRCDRPHRRRRSPNSCPAARCRA